MRSGILANSGMDKISQFRQNTPVQKYFLTWIEKPRPANVFSRFLWRVFSDFAWGPVEPAQFLRSLTIHVTLGPMHLPIGRTPRPSPAGFTYPRNKPGFMLQYFFRVWCTIHRKLQHTPAYNWGVLALKKCGMVDVRGAGPFEPDGKKWWGLPEYTQKR